MPKYSSGLSSLLNTMNEYQIKAVNAGAGLYCVVGSPGSGKTRVIIARIARLIEDGFPPEYILAMTFTKAAAQEMNERLKALSAAEKIRIGTIHSVCRQIIAQETKLLADYSLDEKGFLGLELKKTLSEMRKNRKIAQAGVDLEAVSRFISDCKACGPCYVYGNPFGLNIRSEEHIMIMAQRWLSKTGLHISKSLVDIYFDYERRRAIAGMFDFDDMLAWAWMILISNSEARARWRSKYGVVIVDEIQDSSSVQWDLSRLLVGLDTSVVAVQHFPNAPRIDDSNHNLMVAGDVSQSIYKWRSAAPDDCLAFAKRRDVTTLLMPINYRSNTHICKISTKLVITEPWHLAGEIKSAYGGVTQGAVSVHRYDSMEDEAKSVVTKCKAYAVEEGLRSCTILSRLSVGLDLIELECIKNKMKYIRRSSGSFLETSEVKDLLAYIRVASGCDSTGKWLKHIINRPFRYIGKNYINECEADANQLGISLLDSMMARIKDLSVKQHRSLNKFAELLVELNKLAVQACTTLAAKRAKGDAMNAPPEHPFDIAFEELEGLETKFKLSDYPAGPSAMLAVALDRTDYIEEMRREEGLLGMSESKLAGLALLQRIARSFESPIEFLSYVDTLTVALKQASSCGLRVQGEKGEDALILSTIHSFKGLQSQHIFLVDVVKGHLPHVRSEDKAEELRLFYVAITRAAKTCEVSYSGAEETTELDKRGFHRSPFINKLLDILKETKNG